MPHSTSLYYIERTTKKVLQERIYGRRSLTFLYGPSLFSRMLGRMLLPLLSYFNFFSYFYGLLQKAPWSKRKIKPFIKDFQVDETEFLEPISYFSCFNDFFIRKLKPQCRPIIADTERAIIPADGRYFIHEDISTLQSVQIKGKAFDLSLLLKDETLAKKYRAGSMVVARLCPYDYHRYHFPFDCYAPASTLINGSLYSVNPLALKYNAQIFMQNKRMICPLQSSLFGVVLYIEIGATNVGSINQTYACNQFYEKGQEKGFFSFGGSTIVLLFEPCKILFDEDLLQLASHGLEIRCLLGQSLGRAYNK